MDGAVRPAVEADLPDLVAFVRELAREEGLPVEVVATEEGLGRSLFGPSPAAEAAVACVDGGPVGFAVYFPTFSTALGRPGLHLDDLYVRRAFRGRGLGLALLRHVAGVARARGCERLEWWTLDWNEEAKRFYEHLGAKARRELVVFRADGGTIAGLAKGDPA